MMTFGQLERKIGWVAFPGFLRYYAMMHVLVFVLQWIRPGLGMMLEFDRAKILSGEVWRLATCFFAAAGAGRPSVIALVFLVCAVNFAFMVSDGLEGAWGAFKASLFYYAGIVLMWVGSFIHGEPVQAGGFALYGSAFLAFAVLYPKVEILLLMLIPVRVGLLGAVTGAGIVITGLLSPSVLPFLLLACANFIVWAGIPALRGTVRVMESVQRKKRFEAKRAPEDEPFHRCEVCRRTERSDPELEFRTGADHHEYCLEHLPE